jgi:hypothetical protein
MMRCEWTSRRFPQQCVLPSPQTPTTLLSTAHSGSARPTPADEANGPVGIAWRAWELWSRGRANTFECRRGICSRSDAKLRMFTGHTRTRVAGVGRAPHAPSVGCRVHTTRGRVTQPPERFPAPRMGAFASQSARATRNELKVLQDIAFRRALRKQDRRLDRDAEALRKERRATGGKTTDGGDGERDNARRTTSNETTDEGRSHISSMPKREPSEKRRTKRLGARRRRARRGWSARDGTRVRVHDASWNGIREGNNGGVTRKGDSNANPTRPRIRIRIRIRSRIRIRIRMAREARERYRPGSRVPNLLCVSRRYGNSARATTSVLCDASASASVDDGKPRPNKHAKKQKPITELASAEILPSAAAADVERRTGELNPPGTSRGGLRLKYE